MEHRVGFPERFTDKISGSLPRDCVLECERVVYQVQDDFSSATVKIDYLTQSTAPKKVVNCFRYDS